MEPTPAPSSLTTTASGDGAPAEDGPYEEFPPEVRARGEAAFWWAAGALYRSRWFIVGLTFLAAVGSVVISLMLPLWYRAETRLLMPEGGGAYNFIDDLTSGAAALIGGGGGGEYTRYLSIVLSRTVLDRTVEAFDLERVYEVEDSVDPRGDAIRQLAELINFDVAVDFDHLSISVLDRDPDRAAEMANFLVEQLNQEHIRLTAANARQTREAVGARLEEAEVALDSAQADLQAFQERSGLLDLEMQGAAFFDALAAARASEAELEIEFGTLRRLYGPENPQAEAAANALAEARAQRQRLESGRERLLPVDMSELPEASRRYAELYQEVLTQSKILEVVRPLYEQARFEESREAEAVQVLDEAIPPVRKAKPKRSIIVIAATLSTFLLLCAFVLAWAWWRDNAARVSQRLRTA